MARQLVGLIGLAALVLVLLVRTPGAGRSWLTAEVVGTPARFTGVVRGELRLEVVSRDHRRLVLDLEVAPDAAAGPAPLDVVLLLDRSNSMRLDGRFPRAKQWVRGFEQRLGPEDRLAVVGYARDARVLRPLGPAGPGTPQARLEALRPAGPSNLAAGLEAASRLVGEGGGSSRRVRVVALAGGRPNHGPSPRLPEGLRRRPDPFCLVDLAAGSPDSLAELETLRGDYVTSRAQAGDPSARAVDEALRRPVGPAVRQLRLRTLGKVATQLVFAGPGGSMFIGGGRLGDRAAGDRMRLVADIPFSPRDPRRPDLLGVRLDYQVPHGGGWRPTQEGVTLSF